MRGRSGTLHGLGGAALLLLAAGCAQPPDTIAAAPVGEARYFGWTCPELRAELGLLDHALAGLYAEQRQSRNDDALGYIFTLAPAATLSRGDLSHQIALRKGEQAAVQQAAGRCPHAARF